MHRRPTRPQPILAAGLTMVLSTACADVWKSDTGGGTDSAAAAPAPTLTGFIGSPCESDADCPYDGGLCLPDASGLPGGMCSAPCDEYCPDASGHPTTFCISPAELSPAARSKFRDGACVSRCNYGAYPAGGCREDYGCTEQKRYGQLDRETWACTPGAPDSHLPACYQQLADQSVAFEADIRPPDALDGSARECTIEAAIWLERSVKGVRLEYEFDPSIERTLAACSLGLALSETIDELKPLDIVAIQHMGTYACRTVSGTSTPSRHAWGDAIDFSGFTFANGTAYTVVDDWEHDTYSDFDTAAGRWLYNRASYWHNERIWSVVLTPNYNAAHDNHFHVDLTPGSNYMAREAPPEDCGLVPAGYFGPAPYAD